jgi:hypothetical protein
MLTRTFTPLSCGCGSPFAKAQAFASWASKSRKTGIHPGFEAGISGDIMDEKGDFMGQQYLYQISVCFY